MTNAPAGALVIVFDVDFLDPTMLGIDPNSWFFTNNLIGNLTPVVTPSSAFGAPTLSEWGMILLALGLVLVAARKLHVPRPADPR